MACTKTEEMPPHSTLHMAPAASQSASASLDYAIASSNSPAGPASLEELLCWPGRVVETIMCRHPLQDTGKFIQRTRRLQRALEAGVIVSSDYSGKQSSEFAVLALQVHLKQRLQTPPRIFHCFRACDHSSVCLDLIAQTGWSSHAFGDLLHRIPEEEKEAFESLLPGPAMYADQRPEAEAHIMKCHHEVLRFLVQRGAAIFADQAKGVCKLHKDQCYMYPQAHRHWRRLLHSGAWQLNMAGPCCTPWSAQGARKGMCDKATVAFLIWVAERQWRKEDQGKECKQRLGSNHPIHPPKNKEWQKYGVLLHLGLA